MANTTKLYWEILSEARVLVKKNSDLCAYVRVVAVGGDLVQVQQGLVNALLQLQGTLQCLYTTSPLITLWFLSHTKIKTTIHKREESVFCYNLSLHKLHFSNTSPHFHKRLFINLTFRKARLRLKLFSIEGTQFKHCISKFNNSNLDFQNYFITWLCNLTAHILDSKIEIQNFAIMRYPELYFTCFTNRLVSFGWKKNNNFLPNKLRRQWEPTLAIKCFMVVVGQP